MILLNPTRENVTCPKGLPRGTVREGTPVCFIGARVGGQARQRCVFQATLSCSKETSHRISEARGGGCLAMISKSPCLNPSAGNGSRAGVE